jgi:excisionase family DNA binding protein
MTAVGSSDLNLKQVAASLGVHYMTAYRYVRTGRLQARLVGSGWVVDRADLEEFASRDDVESGNAATNGREILRKMLVAGDETAAWRVIESALAGGRSPASCYIDLIVGSIDDISSRTTLSSVPVAEEYLATATATRLVARLGARFRRPGRTRGTVVFGAPTGETHTLPISVVADLVRLENFTCLELGANVPPTAFAGAVSGARHLVAVGIGISMAANLDGLRETVEAVRAVDPSVPVLIGGQGARDPATAAQVGATAWAPDGSTAVDVIVELARERRSLWSSSDFDPAEELSSDRGA